MPTVTITVGVFRWTTPTGTRALATNGQQIELETDTVERYKHLDVFEVDDVSPPSGLSLSEISTGASEPPDKPAYAATKAVWVDYADALHRHTDGRSGLTATDADQLSRRDLINALATTKAPVPQGAQNYQTPTPGLPELAQVIPPSDSESFEDDHVERTQP